mgnify:CR=1 FL=1
MAHSLTISNRGFSPNKKGAETRALIAFLRCLPSHSPAEAPMQIDEHGGYRQDFDVMGF